MNQKIKVGDWVRIKNFEYFRQVERNPYIMARVMSSMDAFDRLQEVAEMQTEVIEVHPAGFFKLAIDQSLLDDDGDIQYGHFYPDMVMLSPKPREESMQGFDHTQAAATKRQNIRETARYAMMGLCANPSLNFASNETLVEAAVSLAKALELKLE